LDKNNRWQMNLYSIWFAQILSIMSFNLGMPFMAFYIQEMGVNDPSQIKFYAGLLSAGPAVALGIMGPIWGRLADKFGKKIMMVRAIAFASLVMFGLGMSTHVWQLVVLRFGQGIFTGTVAAAAALVASTVPENKLGYSLGFLASSTAIGSSVGPAIGGIVAEWLGYRYSFLMGAGLMLLDLFIVILFVKDNEAPQKIHLFDNRIKLSTLFKGNLHDTWLNTKSLFTNSALERRNRKSLNKAPKMTSFLSTKWFISAMIMFLVLRFATSIFGPYMPIFVQDKLQTLEGAAGTTGLVNAFISVMMALSGIFLGKLSDKYDRVKLLRIYTFAGLILAIPLQFSNVIWTLALNYGFMMFFIGGIEPVLMSATTRRIHRDQRGTLFGMQTMIGSLGWGLSPMLGGYLSIRFSVTAVLIAIPIILLIELVLASTIGKHLVPYVEPKEVM